MIMKKESKKKVITNKRKISTFERELKNPKFKKDFYENYSQFLLSELLIAMMEKDNKSVRQLAKEVDLSATIIQKLRSQKQTDIKLSNFLNIAHACGYHVALERNDEKIYL